MRFLEAERYCSYRSFNLSMLFAPAILQCSDEHVVHLWELYSESGDLDFLDGAVHAMRRAVECAPELDLQLTRLNFLGRFLRARFERLATSEDLESALSVTARAVQLTSNGHPDQAMWLNNIAAVLRARYEHHGQIIDLDKGISSYYAAMQLMPEEGHSQMPTLLHKLGWLLTSRYERLGELHDLETTMMVLNRARAILPDDHPDVPTLMYNIGITLYSRQQRSGDISDLESAIVTQKGALALYMDNSPNKLMTLDSLVQILLHRYQLFGELETLDDAISMSLAAVELSVELNLEDSSRLIRHRSTFHRRFQCLGNLTDLEASISTYHRVAILMPDDHPDKPSLLRTLGDDLYNHYKLTHNLDDLEGTIAAQSRAVELSLDNHPDKPMMLDSLVNALLVRYELLDGADDIDRAVSMSYRCVDLTADESPNVKAQRVNSLGFALRRRFTQRGNVDDLETAVVMYRRAVDLAPDSDPDKPLYLINVGNALHRRYELLNILGDLENEISFRQRAIDMIHEHGPHRSVCLNDLGVAYENRYARLSELDDLEHAIRLFRQATNCTVDVGADESISFDNLGSALQSRYERLGDLDDLDNAILAFQHSLRFTTDDHAEKSRLLYQLADSQMKRYYHKHTLDDLESAVSGFHYAFDLASHTDDAMNDSKSSIRGSLFGSLLERYHRLGELQNIEDAISIIRSAIDSDFAPSEEFYLFGMLGVALRTRYSRLRSHIDLENAILALNRAIDIRSVDDFDNRGPWYWVWHLCVCLQMRYEDSETSDDLERAISLGCRAVDTLPDSDERKSAFLNIIGTLLHLRHQRLGDPEDIQSAISMQRRAVDLTTVSDKAFVISNLSDSLWTKYERENNLEDLEAAISLGRQALDLIPEGHFHKAYMLGRLAMCLQGRLWESRSRPDFDAVVECLVLALSQPLDNPFNRLSYAAHCVILFREHLEFSDPETHILVFTRVLDFLPERVWLGYNVIQRYKESAKLHGLIKTAVATVIEYGKLELAVEWLEEGRALVWSQILSLRAPLDDLSQQQPDLAYRFREVLTQLRGSAHRSLLPDAASGTLGNPGQVVTNTAADHHRQLAITHESLLSDIRACAGFEDFMRPKKFAALIPPPHTSSGPVVFINVAVSIIYDQACSALILFPGGLINSVTLSELSPERADRLRSLWTTCIQRKVRERHTARVGLRGSSELGSLLEHLWTWIVEPILRELKVTANSVDGNALPHITWCPTGPLTQLPLHAAGLYEEKCGPRVFDFVVSSYIPSLSALLRCQQLPSAQVATSGPVLVVTQPHTPGLPALPGTVTEGIRLQKRLSELQISCTVLNDDQATTEYVGAILSQHPWIHLACHGSQHSGDPTQSAFALFDGPLSLSDLMGTVADNAELAFLSACQTAVGDYQFPEESAHLAAGMLAVGFKGVVATMWSIGDKDAPIVVEEYYKRLLELRRTGAIKNGSTGAAYALHEAVGCLRDEVGVENFEQWAPFAHFGV